MNKNRSVLEAKLLTRPSLFKALRRESGLFLSYLPKTQRILFLNALKSTFGSGYHGVLFACSETKSGMRRIRNQFVSRS